MFAFHGNGKRLIRILTYATNPVRLSSPWIDPASIGLGSGLVSPSGGRRPG
jgi:hypothetical protein